MFTECQDKIDAAWVADHPQAAAALEDMLEAFESNTGRFPGPSEMAGIVKLCREQNDPAKIFVLHGLAYLFLGLLALHFLKLVYDILEVLL